MENIKSRITLTFTANSDVFEYDKPFLLEESYVVTGRKHIKIKNRLFPTRHYVEERITEMNGLSETSGLRLIQKRLDKQLGPFLWLYIYLNNEYVVHN